MEGEAIPHECAATSTSRNNCLVASGGVSVISAQRPRLMYRNCYRPATLSLPTMSLSSQLLSDEERQSWRYRPVFPTAVTPNVTGVYTLPVVSPARGNSRTRVYWKRVVIAPDQLVVAALQGRLLVAGCVPDRKNVVVSPPHVAIREADPGAGGVASRRWSRPSSRPPRLR